MLKKLFKNKMSIGLALLPVILVAAYAQWYRANTAAYVNGERILVTSFNKRLETMKKKDPSRFSGPEGAAEEKRVKRMLLDERIALKTIRQYAVKAGINISEDEIDLEIKRLRRLYKSGAAFRKTLESEGLTDSLLRDIMRDEIAARKMRIKLAGEAKISAREAKDYVEDNEGQFTQAVTQVRLSKITVRAEDEATKIMSALKNGSDFGDLAAKRSVDKKGINLGWQLESYLDNPIKKALGKIKVDENTPPIPNADNTLSIYRLDKRESRKSTEEEMRDQVAAKLLKDKQNNSFMVWFKKIQKRAKIQAYI